MFRHGLNHLKCRPHHQLLRFRGSDHNSGVEVVGLGTDHRLSLAQNPVLLAGQIAILLASCNRDVARLRKRRQVAGREEVRAVGNAARPSAFCSAAPRPSKRFAGIGGYDQMAALIGLKVAQRPHGAHYSIFRN